MSTSSLELKKKIIHIFPTEVSFIKKDQRLLAKHFKITAFLFKAECKMLLPLVFIRQLIFLCINSRSASAYFIQFAGYHSLLPVVFGKICNKPVLILLGGTDCVSFPSINYGNFRKRLLRFFTKWSILLSDHLTPVHRSLVYSSYTYTNSDFNHQGFQFFLPMAKGKPWTEIFNGYGSDLIISENAVKSQNTFLTVTQTLKGASFYRKGIDLIFTIAPEFPFCTFTIVGADIITELEKVPGNIKLIPPVPHSELMKIYASHEFYLQLSICEGFPNALCEAMINKCIPIVSNVAAMPFIVDNTGFVLLKKNVELLKHIMIKALNCDRDSLATLAKERILENFTEDLRDRSLTTLLFKLISNFGN